MNLRTFWKPRMVIRFFLDGGAVMDVPCRDYSVKWLKDGGKLTGYNVEGMPKGNQLLTLDVNKVIAVQRIK